MQEPKLSSKTKVADNKKANPFKQKLTGQLYLQRACWQKILYSKWTYLHNIPYI